MPPQIFTQDDVMFPVYCTSCRTHIPRSVSNANNGLCVSCAQAQAASNALQMQSQAQAAAVAQAQAVAAQQAIWARDTGNGICPNCRSRNITVSAVTTMGRNTAMGNAAGIFLVLGICLVCVYVGIVFLVLSAVCTIVYFGSKQPKVLGYQRNCNACGNQWT